MCFGAPQVNMPPPPKVPPPPPAPNESATAASIASQMVKNKSNTVGDLLRIPQARNSGTGLNV